MYSDTKEKIANIIKESNGISAHAIIRALNLNASGIFRHLKKLTARGLITKVGKPPKVLYYYSNHINMNQNKTVADEILNWATTGNSANIKTDWICETRDVFEARQKRLLNDLKNLVSEDTLYVLVAMVGEIGLNSFDHNIGNWHDTRGVIFALDLTQRQIILSDRGQGVLSSLKRVRPNITTASDALKIAFTETISGRAPEQRGNGLKFVKNGIADNNLSLRFCSGDAAVEITSQPIKISMTENILPGTWVLINF